jgi:hypothetical protein
VRVEGERRVSAMKPIWLWTGGCVSVCGENVMEV